MVSVFPAIILQECMNSRSLSCGILCVLMMFCLSRPVHAEEECRQPTAQEKAAAEKLAHTLYDKVVTPLKNSGWEVESEKSALTSLVIATNPGPPRPLMDCAPIFDVTLRAKPDSPEGKKVAQASAMMENAKTADDFKKIGMLMASGQIHIRAGGNEPYIHSEMHTPIKRLDVPGVPVAYTTAANSDPAQPTTFCYGAFKPEVTFGSNNKYIPFPFAHGKQTPYVENMCVTVTATPEVTDQLLKEIHWAALDAALTR